MKKLNSVHLILSPLLILSTIGILWVYLLKPKLIEFAIGQIPLINDSQDKFNVSLEKLEISFLKLQVSAQNINLSFKGELQKLTPVQIEKLKVQLDPFKLLVGQIELSKVQAEHVNWQYLTEEKSADNSKNEELPLDDLFKVLPQIPVNQVIIIQSDIQFKDIRENIDLSFTTKQITIFNNKSQLTLSVKNLISSSNHSNQKNMTAEVNFETTLNYYKESSVFNITSFNIKALNSFFNLNGQLIDFKNILKNPQGKIKIDSDLNFDDLRTIGLSFFPQKNRIPSITGSIKTSGDLHLKSLTDINGQLLIQTTQVNIDHFKLGHAQVKAEIKKNQIFINALELEHPSGFASLKQIEIEQKAPYNFKAQLKVNNFELQKLFTSIGLRNIPVGLQAEGLTSCQGQLEPTIQAACDVNADLKDVWVKADIKEKFHIVKLKAGHLNGQVNFNQDGLNYKTNIKLGDSNGSSSGQVLFKEGFKINFETNKLSFDDVESLADLNFKGDLKFKGQTSGDSDHGIVDADVSFSNAEIDRFKLGKLDSVLKYEKTQLYLKQIKGLIGQTNYSGDVHFNFLKSTLDGDINIPEMYGADIFTALNTRFYLPFELTGKGKAAVQLSGPLDFWKLTYTLNAYLKQGQIANEGFDNLQFDLKANGENIRFTNVFLKKAKSKLTLDGSINTTSEEPKFEVKTKVQPLFLEEIDHISQMTNLLSGQAWVDGQITGPLLNPELTFNFNAKQINFDNVDYPGSQGQVTVTKKYLKVNGQLLGRQIQTDSRWPWNEKDDYALKLQIRDLNSLLLLPFISLPQSSSEFYSRLNADVDLKGSTRQLKTSDGTVRINDFMLQRGALYLKLNKSASLFYKNGLKQIDPFILSGENNNLSIQMANSKKDELRRNTNDELRLNVVADLQLKLFQFLVPFAQTLNGHIEANSQVAFKNNNFELFGEGEITDGLVNLKGFPQAIESIDSPIVFSQSKIILDDITALIGQSELSGSGQIDIRGQHEINVNMQASADNIDLVFPEQITTNGKADLVFFGNWLPYTLKVNYKVNRGLVEKDFGQDTSQNKTSLKASSYLPPQQIEQQAPSLLLDVMVDLTQGIIVKNRLVEGEAFGKLKINGTPEHPTMAGKIEIKPGSKFFFKDKPFDIQTATIQFPTESTEINPDIYLSANSHVSDYDISLLVQGPSKNLTINPSSQPPLSKEDIFTLLALGLTSSKMDQNLSSETQQKQTGLEVLAAISNQSQINKKFQEKFGLTVQLAPTVDSTKNIAVPKVVVSKKLQKNINASYSRPLTGDTQNQEWKLQYLFNSNKSVILNYQNKETTQQEQIRNTNINDQGILGLDFEYKKEFK